MAVDRPPHGRKAWRPELPVVAAPASAWLLTALILGGMLGAMGLLAALS
ncbi:MAG: hypothetical protein HC788_09200 [Sphingopyxis sp.]|nr:hypothetical protein [Sphingopyxis sp.]